MKKKKVISDAVSAKKSKKPYNPFEVHTNRQKYNVLGKQSKAEKGLPGVSRSRAIKKRKVTLLQEYSLKGKNNKFLDRRIGERNSAMTADDKIMARYTAERMKFHSKKSLYNLDDNEVLTHRGESLADIEKFDDPKSDDDDEHDDRGMKDGKLGEAFVSDAHFGGGMLKKSDGNQSRKDLIEQMIADSKKRKFEMQKLREHTLELTEKLDTEFKDIFPMLNSTKKARVETAADLKVDKMFASYDKLSKELKFEPRGLATDKLKSVEEIAKEEKAKLEKLEKERLERMIGAETKLKCVKHRSADDLDDGFDYDDEYIPGKSKERKKAEVDDDSDHEQDLKTTNVDDSESSSDSECEEEEQDDVDADDNEDDTSSSKIVRASPGPEASDESDSESDDLSDLKSSDEEEEPDESQPKIKAVAKSNQSTPTNDELKDLPFTLPVPKTYEKFEKVCAGRTPESVAVIVERMVKSNHPSLKDGSRDKMVSLLTYLLQYLQDVATDSSLNATSFQVLDKLSPHFFDLTQFAPLTTITAMSDVIREKYEEFLKKPKIYPTLECIIFMKLVSILFPTSDYRHRLVTPTLVFMQNILSSCVVKSSIDVSSGLFIATLILEYSSLSKRITPEAINFLYGILRSALPADSTIPWIPPFKSKAHFSLHLDTTACLENEIKPMATKDLISEDKSLDFKVRAVHLALELIQNFCKFSNDPSTFLLFERFVPLLKTDDFSQALKSQIESTLTQILRVKEKKLLKLVAEKKKTKALKLYEPKLEQVYTFRKKRPMSKDKEEHNKLLHKYKKEVKGALREIRRDNTFLAHLKLKETKASDMERRRKVKEIFGDAANQAGELRKIKRTKK